MPAVANPAIEAKYGPVVGIVDSSSDPDTKYEVRHNASTQSWSCQCMGYRFNRYCRHIMATQLDMAMPVTQTGKKLVAAPKVKPRTAQVATPQRASQPHEQPSLTLHIQQEATLVATKIRNTAMAVPVAIGLVEAAIRKFMMAVPVPAAVPVTMGSGIRMITLDE